MLLVIDRFEGVFAVCEDENKNIVNIKREIVPKEAKEGDILVQEKDKYVIDYNSVKARKKYIKELTNDLWE